MYTDLCTEGLVKASKFLVVIGLLCLGLLVFLMPALNVGAQDSTATPQVIIITATPSGDTQSGAATTDASLTGTAAANGSNSTDTPVIQAVKAAETALAKQLGTNYAWVKAHLAHYTYETAQAKECPPTSGKATLAGDNFGWIIGITTFGKQPVYFFTLFNFSTIYHFNKSCAPPSVASSPLPPPLLTDPYEAR